jgi:hypothetical protein
MEEDILLDRLMDGKIVGAQVLGVLCYRGGSIFWPWA